MNPIVRGVIAVIMGFVLGGIVNMGIIMLGSGIIPAPEGVDVSSAGSIAAGMHLFEPKHFITPFLAHALGTLVAATLAGVIAANHRMRYALGMGGLSLVGGIYAATVIPAPVWFIAVDLIGAYIPMGALGGILAVKLMDKEEKETA